VRLAFALIVLIATWFAGTAEAAPRSVYLEDLTWTELRDAIKAGATTVIIPVGGTEQSGPHIALGKHNARVKVLAGKVAAELGDTLVAPVLAYVPEGNISPPSEHMRFPGTISISDNAFKGTLEAAARSLKQAGFTHIVLLGDHGGYQAQLKEVAAQLNREWAGTPARAHFIDDYYRTTQTAYAQALRAKGLSDAQIGSHAGTADTSLQMAVDPAQVRTDRLEGTERPGTGTIGDPRPSTAALGQLGVELIVAQTVAAIKKARAEKR
jgi:creatinine amidohydrolase/Fe(II)-dependent formamide hydrolase-like protein